MGRPDKNSGARGDESWNDQFARLVLGASKEYKPVGMDGRGGVSDGKAIRELRKFHTAGQKSTVVPMADSIGFTNMDDRSSDSVLLPLPSIGEVRKADASEVDGVAQVGWTMPLEELNRRSKSDLRGSRNAVYEFCKKTKKAIVRIQSHTVRFNQHMPLMPEPPQTFFGTGSLVSVNGLEKFGGLIVTNAHVVLGQQKTTITIPYIGQEQFEVDLIGISQDRDVALLRMPDREIARAEKLMGEPMEYMEFADSDNAREGTDVYALGFPMGDLNSSVTRGVVSGRGSAFGRPFLMMTAPINHGNSGGALVNDKWQIIGIPTAGQQGTNSRFFAIQSNEVVGTVLAFRENPVLHMTTMGINFAFPNKEMFALMGMPDSNRGLFIKYVHSGSVADRAGVKRGDIITHFNGHEIDKFGEVRTKYCMNSVPIQNMIARVMPKDELEMKVMRAGKQLVLRHVVDTRPKDGIRDVHAGYEPLPYMFFAGLTLTNLNNSLIDSMMQIAPHLSIFKQPAFSDKPVVVVTNVFPGSEAYSGRMIGPGMVVSMLNGKPVSDVVEMIKMMSEIPENDTVMIESRFSYGIFATTMSKTHMAELGQSGLLCSTKF
jgi:S1-C subfamily serine protease